MATHKKRIVACSDGTWNSSEKETHTNVELFYNCINEHDANGIQQVKIYDAGVGSSSFDTKDQVFGGIIGAGIDQNIKDVYTFLMLNYQPGDEIYLFGFSRGAYTSRSVAGFINNCGILKPENLHLIDNAYELYRSRDKYASPDSDMMKSFRQNYCVEPETGVYFIGVWDTVGSLGFPWKKKYNAKRYKFHDVKISSKISYAYHALSIDESRSEFAPTLWELTDTVKNTPGHKQVLEQRWFPGVHSNVGGGYANSGLSDLALEWLFKMASNAGLSAEINGDVLNKKINGYQFNPTYKGTLYNSMSLLYWITFSYKPRTVMIERKNEKGERMVTNEVLDDSVLLRYNDAALKYKPKNLRNAIIQYNMKQAK
ncbi:MAG TPA: DUF2235 domain-containing protein [Flavobacteriales bacterium]|nr:DUF2235 domain-containing protein [Flavobacteriales bacterium]